MKCKKCGEKLKEGAVCCEFCGEKVQDDLYIKEKSSQQNLSIKDIYSNFKIMKVKEKVIVIFVLLLILGMVDNVVKGKGILGYKNGNSESNYTVAIHKAEDYLYDFYRYVDCKGVWADKTNNAVGMVIQCEVKMSEEDKGLIKYFCYFKRNQSSRYTYWLKDNLNDSKDVIKKELSKY